MVRFVFKMLYTPMLAVAPNGVEWSEKADCLHTFKSRDLVHPSDAYDVTVFDVRKRLDKRLVINIHPTMAITSTSGIGFNAYCHTFGEQGYECRSTAGSGFLYIEDIVRAIEIRQPTASLYFNIALVEHTCMDERKRFVVKGRIRLLLLDKECQLSDRTEIECSRYIFLSSVTVDHEWRRRMLKLCQKTVMEVNKLFQPSEPKIFTETIRCPVYENNRLVLPGSAYLLYDRECVTSIEVFHHLLNISLKRHSITADALHDLLRTDDGFFQNRNIFSNVVAHMVCMISWSLPYLTDFVNRNRRYPFKPLLIDNRTNEHYKLTLVVGEGDCDGLAWLIHLVVIHAELVQLEPKFPLTFRILQLIQRFYAPFHIQGAVTMCSAAEVKMDSAEGLACHTYDVLMPIYAVQKAVRKVKQKIPGTDAIKTFYSDDRESVLELILLEGTGPCAPLQLEANDCNEPLKHHVQLVDELEELYPELCNLQRLMYRHCSNSSQSFSRFYRSAVTAYTSYFYKRYGIPSLDVAFIRCIKSTFTYGITAKELFSLDSTNGLYFFNNLYRKVYADIKLIDVISAVMQQLEPVPLMSVPSEQQAADVKNYVNAFMKTALYDNLSVHRRRRQSADSVVYYCRLDNLNNSLMATLHELHSRGAILNHRVVPLVSTELLQKSKDTSRFNFPFTAIELEIDVSQLTVK